MAIVYLGTAPQEVSNTSPLAQGQRVLAMKSRRKRSDTSRSQETEIKATQGENAAIAIALLLFTLLWISSFFPEKRLWRFNHWAHFPLWLRTIVIILGFLISVPRVNRKIGTTVVSPWCKMAWMKQVFLSGGNHQL